MATCIMIKPGAEVPDVLESALEAERRALAQKILAIHSLDPAQIARIREAAASRSKPAGFRVAKVRTARAHFGDFEEEPTEEERRLARAQVLIARTLRQASRRQRRRRVRILPLCLRGWTVRSFSPLVSYLRWIRSQPWLRWIRKQYSISRVTSSSQADVIIADPLLPLPACEGEWQQFD